jgi:hypothetical protein
MPPLYREGTPDACQRWGALSEGAENYSVVKAQILTNEGLQGAELLTAGVVSKMVPIMAVFGTIFNAERGDV